MEGRALKRHRVLGVDLADGGTCSKKAGPDIDLANVRRHRACYATSVFIL